MRGIRPIAWAVALWPLAALAQDEFKAEPLKEAPPKALAAAVAGELGPEGLRIIDDKGKPFAEIWLRKAVPASDKPAGPKGTVQFPYLSEGELVGALRFVSEGRDYRDQPIAPGVYTLRYGLQPVNGDHLGVSPFRDYALLVPAKKDLTVAAIPQKKLEPASAESAGTSHPAVLMLLMAPEGAKPASLVHNEEKHTWGAVLPLSLAVKGESAPAPLNVQLIVVGSAME